MFLIKSQIFINYIKRFYIKVNIRILQDNITFVHGS